MINVELTQSQSRCVAVQMLSNDLYINKQYMSDVDLRAYKHILSELSNLVELDEIQKRFDIMWPTDLTWNSIGDL